MAVNNNDDTHDETDENDNTPLTRRGISQTPKVGSREMVDRASSTWCATTNVIFVHALIPATHAVRHIPPRPPFRQHVRPLSFRDIHKNSSLESTIYRPSSPANTKTKLQRSQLRIRNSTRSTRTRSTLICRPSIRITLLQCLTSNPFICSTLAWAYRQL